MKPLVFVTANPGKHREIARLLSGLDVRWERLDLARPDTQDLEVIARARVTEAFARLGGAPCFLENTGLYLYDHALAPGASFKKAWRELGEEGFAARYGGSRGLARVAVAYAASADDVRVFEGSIAGTLLARPRGEGGYGYDRLWVPDGYDRTLGEMTESTYVLNMRVAPYLELWDHLRAGELPRSSGTFEVHVTVAPGTDVEAFRVACGELGLKCIEITLPKGETAHQPMTGSFHRGALEDVQREALAIGAELVRRGFGVTRTKIEQHGRLAGAPETDEEAARAPKTSYFEFHLKLALAPDVDLERLDAALTRAGGHLSQNALGGPPSGGKIERFVTLRVPGVGRAAAEARFAALLDVAAREGVTVRSRVREYTVFDTKPSVDDGWIS